MEERLRPGPSAAREHFGYQRTGDRPFATHPERHQESEDCHLPPGLGQGRKAGEQRVGQDCPPQGSLAAKAIAQKPEQDAAQRPAGQEGGEGEVVVIGDLPGRRLRGQQRRHRFVHAGNEDLALENVEDPTERGDGEHQPLIARDAGVPR
jgi:hypothetical protein